MAINIHIIPWYTPAEWEKVKAVSLDPDTMGLTFDDWLNGAEELAKSEESGGATVNKAYINADELVTWARRNGLDIVSKNRVRFALDNIRPF